MRKNKKQNQDNQSTMTEKTYGRNLSKVTKIGVAIYLVIAVILSTLLIIMQNQKSNKLAKSKILDPELARAMTYEQFEPGSDDVYSTDGETKVDNVKFSAFFLRDLDGDGYAEKIKGTCKEIGTSDTLYMEINVLTNGKLKNAKVEIDGKNFYLLTALPKDQQIKNNAIGINTKLIEFNDMVNGTQKLFAGAVRSGNYIYNSSKLDALNNNISNYSRNDNKIILTGTYEDENGNETEIRKEVPLTMDWYGTTRTTIQNTYQNYRDLDSRINEDTQTIDLGFNITTTETENKLFLSSNHVQATIPEFNGYKPLEVKVKSGNVNNNYDETTGVLTIDRTSTTDETGKLTKTVARENTYQVTVKYPLEAYQSMGEASVELLVPVEEYYEGYNNPNTEFTNPYRSNTAKTIVRAVYNKYIPSTYGDSVSIYVGDYISAPYYNYVISKRKPMRIYNGVSTEETDDTYKVQWYYYRGNTGEDTAHITLKETPTQQPQVSDQFLHVDGTYTSMEELTTNVGIYFNNLNNVISTDGEIKVYDEETENLLLTVDKFSFNKYTQSNPYRFDTSVKHLRVEAYGMLKSTNLTVTSIKELDDEYITTNFTEEEFNDLKQIKSTLNASKEGGNSTTVSRNALYELPISIAQISISKDVLSTQETEKNDNIIITAEYYESKNEIGWTNGIFQVKLPDEIIETEINNVTIDNSNVKIDLYEYIEDENGKFIKIFTNNNTPSSFKITIDCNLTPDPRIATTSKNIELYAYNEEGTDYYYKSEDIYDVNNNQNTTEKLNKTTTSISLVAPNSLLTNQTLSEFDEEGTVIVSPNTADVSIKNVNVETEEKTATIGVQIKNNYSSDISEVVILGKIPFEGNTTALTNQDLKSTFTTKMTDTGIEVPEALQGQVDVYYSENETPTKDLNNENNNWKTANEVENWDNIKTFLIDFKDSVLTPSQEYVFYYTVKIPNGTPYNEISNSHHGVYFALNTDEGKYRTQTEPNKIGIRIAEKYNVNLTKYQTNKEKLVSGATYSITDEEGTAKTATTNEQGTLTFNKLYVEKIYEIKEIRSPKDYELNGEAIRFIAHVTETGDIEIEKISGETRGDITVATDPTTNMPTANIQTQDEAKAKLKIIKTEKGTENKLSRVSYKITGEGLPDSGRVLITNTNGEANLNGLKVGHEYTLTETKAEGYYLNEPVKFTITNNNGNYELQVTGENKANNITLDNEIPTITLELEDDKIPTYNLQINKIEKGSQTEQKPAGIPIQGAKFRLYKDDKEQGTYETDENGHILIEGLYQYEQTRDIDQTYKLAEIYAPEGYAKTTDVTFSSQTIEEVLQLDETILENGKAHEYTVDGNTIQLVIEDNPSFKLIKKDGETNELLPNTKFVIYNVEDGTRPARNSKGEILGTKELINGREYYTLTTDKMDKLQQIYQKDYIRQ